MTARHGMFMVTRGIFQHVEGGDLARFVGYPSADFGVLDYLVLNHLAIIVRGDAVGFDISVNAQDFDAKNVAAVADYLASAPAPVQVRIRSFLGGWLTESFLDVDDAIARLRMIGEGALRAPATRLRLVARDPEESCENTDGLRELWKAHQGRFSSEFMDDALGEGVLDRTFVLEPASRSGWVVRYMGSGIGTFGNWQQVGRPLATQGYRSRLHRMGFQPLRGGARQRRRSIRSRRCRRSPPPAASPLAYAIDAGCCPS